MRLDQTESTRTRPDGQYRDRARQDRDKTTREDQTGGTGTRPLERKRQEVQEQDH